jgi:hypothetical protein
VNSATDYISGLVSGRADQMRRSENSDFEVQ